MQPTNAVEELQCVLELKAIKFIVENKLCPGDGYAQRASWFVANGNDGGKPGLLLISDKAEGFSKKRDCINLLHKRILLAYEKGKQACLF